MESNSTRSVRRPASGIRIVVGALALAALFSVPVVPAEAQPKTEPKTKKSEPAKKKVTLSDVLVRKTKSRPVAVRVKLTGVIESQTHIILRLDDGSGVYQLRSTAPGSRRSFLKAVKSVVGKELELTVRPKVFEWSTRFKRVGKSRYTAHREVGIHIHRMRLLKKKEAGGRR